MHHSSLKRIVPNAQNAVLMIHGIIGTPNHFTPFIPLIPDTYSVYNLLLGGHGGSVQDFSKASMNKWVEQVSSAVSELSRSHRNIYIAAHSMGTLLAIEQAVLHRSVRGLFLLAVPIKIRLRWPLAANCFKVYLGTVSDKDALGVATRDSCGINLSRNPFLYLGWIPRYLELFQKICTTRHLISQISVPCYIFQSSFDEMVSIKSAEILSGNRLFQITLLEHSTHFYYDPSDLTLLRTSFISFLDKAPRSD